MKTDTELQKELLEKYNKEAAELVDKVKPAFDAMGEERLKLKLYGGEWTHAQVLDAIAHLTHPVGSHANDRAVQVALPEIIEQFDELLQLEIKRIMQREGHEYAERTQKERNFIWAVTEMERFTCYWFENGRYLDLLSLKLKEAEVEAKPSQPDGLPAYQGKIKWKSRFAEMQEENIEQATPAERAALAGLQRYVGRQSHSIRFK